ncbi:AraC family transcriptional regulator [Ponticoccus sp. SC2-23]|uniref:AraC family transcriptional regulator n=1 Tax=Alexandriicola marinus TaxID=2081710 RepID=UPI000FDC1C6B|nr:AraC family transcriptional regulator [Alexandriicola marinus]MBM1220655.1 AraC family transcriptional regulator [Ponticoccus sp. SC6-9]MBM1225914.1 AraC family transcriptional regulator [Ponticoccus sp. SC6-15]MBM1231211.1 AraC family transcriptional regulator [Ponticoccus sp. SC6-38]MBM1235928.1 AraC family transcriptional regulator [Ponticoccus sp. SC6-45]MBM1240233.1 AraC family transcriptional regulator [Ponticoccus sp. SC6-49]MBM1244768.1 AraC family transcriptional regulator [Pontic
MGQVTSLFARKVVGVAGDDIDARAVLHVAGLELDGPWDPSHMLDEGDFYRMIEMMAEQMDIMSLPLNAGAAMRPDEYGALGLAWKAAPDLRGSFSRVARYWRLWTSVARYELQETDAGVLFIEHREGPRRLGMRISIEADLASGVSLSRQVSPRPFAPLEVYFRHAAPDTLAHHEAFFGCPVHFGADKDAMLLSRQSLSEPNILGDEGITRFLDSHLDQELAQISDVPALQMQTKSEIARALSEGLPKMTDIARRLGLSARSFHRRLAEHGLSFQSLTEETRREIAIAMLQEERYALSEIAFLTGYSEQSAFNRAFKRWMGVTPAAYRKSLR